MIAHPVPRYQPQTFLNQKAVERSVFPPEVWHFRGMGEFIEFLENHPLTPELKAMRGYPSLASNQNLRQLYEVSIDQWGYERPSTKLKFNVAESYDDAVRLAKKGWPEGRKRVADWEAEILKAFSRQVDLPHFGFDLAGNQVDVPSYLAGLPEHMVTFSVQDTVHRAPRICVDINIRCDACGRRAHDASPTPTEWTLIRGAAVSILLKLLLRYGYRPELVVGTVAHYPADRMPTRKSDGARRKFSQKARTTLVTVHSPGDLFDFDAVVFALAHDSFVRKLQFRFEELCNFAETEGIWRDMYRQGASIYSKDSEDPHIVGELKLDNAGHDSYRPMFDYDGQEPGIYLPSYPAIQDQNKRTGNQDHFGNIESATDWLLETLAEQGVKFI